MSSFSVKIDMSAWADALKRLKDKAITAQVRAINRSASTARTGMTRLIAADMGLKAGTVRDRIVIRQAGRGLLSATLTANLKRIPLIDFGARGPEPSRGKGSGVTAKTSTRSYPHAFIATMRSGHRGVFQRKGSSRLPISELRGASVGEVFGKYHDEGVRIAQDALAKNLEHELRFVMQQQ